MGNRTERSLRGLPSTTAGLLLLAFWLPQPSLAAEVQATLLLDASTPIGTDAKGRLRLYAPSPLQRGSSISHWDPVATPSLLMEPFTGSAVIGDIDLTLEQLRDIGWERGRSTVSVRITDPPGEGFHAPGVLGMDRREAIEYVADFWGGLVRSNVAINIDVSFDELPCSNGGATVAQAGAQFVFESFPGAGISNTWYPGPLAEALSGQNLSLEDIPNPAAGDIEVQFNSRIDDDCIGGGATFFYGLGGRTPAGRLSFVNVALHEIAHGLGFSSLVSLEDGRSFLGLPDIFSRHIRDTSSGLLWHQMTAAERVTSATNTGGVVWDGARVTRAAPDYLDPAPVLSLDSPPSVAGRYEASTAEFGPQLTGSGIAGLLAQARDASSAPLQGCQSLVNRSAVSGRIALVDRGGCLFIDKVRNAQAAGAVAVVMVNNVAGPPVGMGGSDSSLGIPTVMIRRDAGELIRAAMDRADIEPPATPTPPPDPDPTPTPQPTPLPTPEPSPTPSTEPIPSTEPPSVCSEDSRTLCLNEERFRVRSRWSTDLDSGNGQARRLTDDTGYFWFFDPQNIELVVKVLNACSEPFVHYWVFAAGLTNVGVELEVADTVTGRVLTYTSPKDLPYRPVQDTDAFATCP